MKRLISVIGLLLLSTQSLGATSATVGVVSDYLFNGVSQTDEGPALQMSLDWANDSGMYAGVWGSNVDFGEGTDIELDGYVGYYTALHDKINLDVGIAQYTYHGKGFSSDYNYAEIYTKFNYENTNVNIWYAWDYFGTGAGHSIFMVTHSIPLSDNVSLDLGVDRSTSHDKDKFEWEPDDDSYFHWKATVNFALKGFDVGIGYEDTDIETYGDSRVLLTVSRTFEF